MTNAPRTLGQLLGSLWEAALVPGRCAACGAPRGGEPTFCEGCGVPPRAAPSELDGVPLIAAGEYAPPLDRAIVRFKYEGRSELARELALLLFAETQFSFSGAPSFVPVPLHRARLVERGYNQAALLAHELARRAGGRFVPRALERLRMTEQQARLGRREREANVRDAFSVVAANVPQRAILVDDVVTTGETARACLKTLQAAGSSVLGVVALAHAKPSGASASGASTPKAAGERSR